MHRTLAIVLTLALSGAAARSQTGGTYEPIPPPSSSQGKIGGAVGYTPGWLIMDLDALNATVAAAGGTPFDGNLMMHGGQGYAYFLLVKNMRIGGMGLSGSRSTTRVETSTNTRRTVELSAGCGGVTVEYAIPVVPRLDLTFGAMLGAGGMSLTIRRDQGGSVTWDGVWGEIGGSQAAAEFTRKLEGSFFAWQPSVSLEVALFRWLGIRAGVGYSGLTGDSWKLDGEYDLAGVPDDVSSRGWMINTGIYLGTFVY